MDRTNSLKIGRSREAKTGLIRRINDARATSMDGWSERSTSWFLECLLVHREDVVLQRDDLYRKLDVDKNLVEE